MFLVPGSYTGWTMFKNLRGRLLISFVAVIITTLLVVAIALFGFATLSGVRFVPALQQLAAISVSNRNVLLRLLEAGADAAMIEQALDQAAAEQGVRILIASSSTLRVIYDSDESGSWLGVPIVNVSRPRAFVGTDRNVIVGRFQHPGGTNWLVYAQPITGFNRLLIFYAQREPTPLSFFRDFFFRSLCGAGIFAFLLSILLAIWIAGSVARPLQKLAGAAEAIAEGNFDEPLGLQGPEEVQRVASSFNSMAARVTLTQQAQRDFLANVSHDLKTPITSITGWSQALLDGTASSSAEQQQAANIIYNEAERMARMVNQLLDLARIESGQLQLAREIVDLGQLLTDVHHNLALRAQEKGIRFTLDINPVPPSTGDPDRLIQVFTNLVDNALTHTPHGGHVHLSVHPHGDQAVEVRVEDTGQGIPSKDLSRIFERFYQVDKSRTRADEQRGSGLGLAIVRELIEAHRGRIQATSQVGKGSTFVVRLPISDEPEAPTVVTRR